MPLRPIAPPHLLTVDEYLAIGEIEPGFSELVEGRLLLAPSPGIDHNVVQMHIVHQLDEQLPDDAIVLRAVDIDLQSAPPGAPGTVPRPDLVVVTREAFHRVRREGQVLRASEVMIVAEVLTPGAERLDRLAKRGEYADAGIPHYWIVDTTEPVSLLACHLAGEFGYADSGAVTGRFVTDTPFPVEIDLDALLPNAARRS